MSRNTKKDMAKRHTVSYMKNRRTRGVNRFVNRILVSRWYRTLVFRYCFATILSIICIPMMLSLVFARPAEANDGTGEVFYKYYHRIEVSEGDTLWSIAQENYHAEEQTIREYIEEVQQINHRYSETVYAGEMLMIPYYSTEFY
ncbi:MAG: LysM peptidoglycan-binding domain-containing protein [Lachnospiraceae bacterium]|nr:LysM peptidoglycan-binding domain-containing protein [Lachnospiraceae bacterium]